MWSAGDGENPGDPGNPGGPTGLKGSIAAPLAVGFGCAVVFGTFGSVIPPVVPEYGIADGPEPPAIPVPVPPALCDDLFAIVFPLFGLLANQVTNIFDVSDT